jgi:hypothetical protein
LPSEEGGLLAKRFTTFVEWDEEQVLTFLETTTDFSDCTRFNVTATLLALRGIATGAVATEWNVHSMG